MIVNTISVAKATAFTAENPTDRIMAEFLTYDPITDPATPPAINAGTCVMCTTKTFTVASKPFIVIFQKSDKLTMAVIRAHKKVFDNIIKSSNINTTLTKLGLSSEQCAEVEELLNALDRYTAAYLIN